MYYHLLVEAHELRSTKGAYKGFRLRLKAAPQGKVLPADWIEIESSEHLDMPERPYAVALLAHRMAAEFGAVRIDPLEPIVVNH